MSNDTRHDIHLANLIHELTRSVMEASDEEIRREAQDSGVNLATNAAQMKARFARKIQEFRKRKLTAAREAYGRESQRLMQRAIQLPTSVEERRALLDLVVAQQAHHGGPLMAKFREFQNLSDDDVTSLLQELAALNLLPDPNSDRS